MHRSDGGCLTPSRAFSTVVFEGEGDDGRETSPRDPRELCRLNQFLPFHLIIGSGMMQLAERIHKSRGLLKERDENSLLMITRSEILLLS